jgi:hypothetical protein
MSREAHVRFWEGVGVRFPCATRLSGIGLPGDESRGEPVLTGATLEKNVFPSRPSRLEKQFGRATTRYAQSDR